MDQNQNSFIAKCLCTQGICLGISGFQYSSKNIVQTTYN